jgi:hypothetical protein
MKKTDLTETDNQLVNCNIEKKPNGWYLTFPQNLKAGWLLNEPEEQIEFLTDCGIPAVDTDLDRIFRMFQVHQCPTIWYDKACKVSDPF